MKAHSKTFISYCFCFLFIFNSHADIPIQSELKRYDKRAFDNKVKYYAKLKFFQGKPYAQPRIPLKQEGDLETIRDIASAITKENFAYTFDAFSTLSFVETILALALAGDVELQGERSPLISYKARFERALKTLRYQRTNPSGLCSELNQNHLIGAQWLHNNKWLLKDETPLIWPDPEITNTKVFWCHWFASLPSFTSYIESPSNYVFNRSKQPVTSITDIDTDHKVQRQDFFYDLQIFLAREYKINYTFPGIHHSKLTYIPIDTAIKHIGKIIGKLPHLSCLIVPISPSHQIYRDQFDTELNTSGIGIVTRFHCDCHVVSVSPKLFDGKVKTSTIEDYLSALKEFHPEVVGIHFRSFIPTH